MNTNDYLMHHGIKGQKWGVRRFQNPDGTRTAAGKKREKENRIDHDTLTKSTNAKELYKHRSQLSDKELQDRLNRLRNEQALQQMAHARTNEGKRIAKDILVNTGKEVLKNQARDKAIKPLIKAGAAVVTKKVLPVVGPAVITAVGGIMLPAVLFPDFMK